MKTTYVLILSFVMTIMSGCSSNAQSGNEVKNIPNSELYKVQNENSAIIIDVRTPEEIAEGYIDGASEFIDYKGSDFEKNVAKLDKEKTYIIYCRSGGRSSSAAEYMIGHGFKNVYNLEGGITEWQGKIIKE